MFRILVDTLFGLGGIPFYLSVFAFSLLYTIKKDNSDKRVKRLLCLSIFAVWAIVILISLSRATIFKEYDPSETKVHHDLNSSTFYAVGYDKRFKKAKLIFNNDVTANGVERFYVYDLPEHVWEEFRLSSSLGEYYNNNIRGKYKSYVVENDLSDDGWRDRD